jgi:serine/threonine-protein kinase
MLPTMTKHPPPTSQPASTISTQSLNFDSMRDFVTGYYNDLPARPQEAWAKLDTHCKEQTGYPDFQNFWATLSSVTLVSVSPRDATSVIARLNYVRRDGTPAPTEDRWMKVVLENGKILLDESGRIGSVSESSTSFSPNAIDQLMLSDDEMSRMLGVTVTRNPAGGGGGRALAIKSSSYGMGDHSKQVDPQACVGVTFTGEHDVYESAHPAAMKVQIFGEQYGSSESSAAPYHVEQTAVVLSSAEQAQRILKSSQDQWNTCRRSAVDVTLGYENGRSFQLGDVEHEDDQIAVRMASWGGLNGLHACQQALGVPGNVVVEARTCEEPLVPNFNWQEPVNPAWATPSAQPLVKAMLSKVTI